MRPRCQGAKTPGHFTSFDCVLDDGHGGLCEPCVLDDGHGGPCEPYVPPSVDEWRMMKDEAATHEASAANEWIGRRAAEVENARLQAELDALRAVVESGAASAIKAADLLAKVRENAYAWPHGVAWACKEAHRLLTGGPPDGVYVKAQRDDLAGLARKGDV